jgi:hypothetical protein
MLLKKKNEIRISNLRECIEMRWDEVSGSFIKRLRIPVSNTALFQARGYHHTSGTFHIIPRVANFYTVPVEVIL